MIYLVYPHGPRRSAPWSIGNHLGAHLRALGHAVVQLDWEAREWPLPGQLGHDGHDGQLGHGGQHVLIGHPHPEPGRAFLELAKWPGWEKRVALCPWTPPNDEFVDRWIDSVDAFVAITGPRWAGRLRPGAVRVDMAIDPMEYACYAEPRPPGGRRVGYVGCTLECKGPGYLEALARARGHGGFVHFGYGSLGGWREAGYIPLDTPAGQAVLANTCDILVSGGTYDANPTTMLEGPLMGLAGACTEGSGWGSDVSITLDSDPVRGADTLRWLEEMPTRQLEQLIAKQREAAMLYTWDRFCNTVCSAAGL